MEIAGWLLERGVRLVAGTDGGTPGSPHCGLVVEIEQLCQAGMTPDEAIGAATSHAAACLGLSDRGVLRPGWRADLIAVPGDPRRRLAALRLPTLVVQRGVVVHRTAEGPRPGGG
jgi:imidazolonepropionase-like amidohydrolase